MNKGVAITLIFASMLVIGMAYVSAFSADGAPAWAGTATAIATAAVMVAFLIIGATRHGRVQHPVLKFVFLLTFLELAVGFVLALRAPAVTADSKLWLGLPQGAAVILYIVGLLPLLVLPLAYAFTFDSTTLSDDDLDEIRRKLAELKR